MSRLLRRRRAKASGGGGGTGDYGYLRPLASTLAPIDANTGVAMTHNDATGEMNGTTVLTTEPTWAFTVPLTDTGNPVTNGSNLQAAINTAASSQTGNTRITYPAGFVTDYACRFPKNTTGFWVGIVPASATAFPPIGSTTGKGTKANRIAMTHFSAQMEMRAPGGNQYTIACDAGDVRRYYTRGLRFTNPTNRTSPGFVNIGPEVLGSVGPTSNTSTSFTFPNGTVIAGYLNTYFWAFRGGLASQVFRCTAVANSGGTSPTITVDGPVVGSVGAGTNCAGFVGPVIAPAPTPSRLVPEDVIFEQWSADGGGVNLAASGGVVRVFYAHGRRIAVVNGYAENCGATGQDSQCVGIAFGEGPFKITNNDSAIGSARENVIIGGSSLPGAADELLPTNVEIRGNVCRGIGVSSGKCHIEIKYGRRVLIEGNWFDERPISFNAAVIVKLTDQTGNNTGTDTQHVLVRQNYSPNGAKGIFYVSTIENTTASNLNLPRNIECVGNVGKTDSTIGSAAGGGLIDLRMEFNTALAGSLPGPEYYPSGFQWTDANQGGYVPITRVINRYNVYGTNIETTFAYGTWIGGADTLYPSPAITAPNVLTSNAAAFSDQVRVAGGFSSIGFVDLAAGNYRLATGAAGKGAGPSGVDFGANLDSLTTIMAGVV